MTQIPGTCTAEVPILCSPRIWRLRFTTAGRERIRILRRGERLVLGSSEEADVCLDDPTVSSRHCEVHARQRGLEVVDLESKNGLFVGAGRVDRALLVGHRASFSIGRTTVEAEARETRSEENSLGLVGNSEAMQRVRERILRYAPLRAPVLILGESGTGKDLVARALHEASGRTGSYCPLNVAAVTDHLLDAELFGHRRGAFTGAVTDREGLFETAADGTLFLDEIAEMSPLGQAKLLRVVEDGRVRAVGANSSRRVDVRLISATCAPLSERISSGHFRHDLYHRLSHLIIEIPPLRSRRDDLMPLAEHYLASIEPEVGVKHLLPATVELLYSSTWPGNVRQLFGVLYRAAVLSSGPTIAPGHIQIEGDALRRPSLLPEKAQELLDIHGSASAAARAAGVPRTTFRSILQRSRGARGD
jgi:DNA-binding NtrC family response regulator